MARKHTPLRVIGIGLALALAIVVGLRPNKVVSWTFTLTVDVTCNVQTGNSEAIFTIDNTAEDQAATVVEQTGDIFAVGNSIPANDVRHSPPVIIDSPLTVSVGLNWPGDLRVHPSGNVTAKPEEVCEKPSTTTTSSTSTSTSTSTTVIITTTTTSSTSTSTSTSTTVTTTSTLPSTTSTTECVKVGDEVNCDVDTLKPTTTVTGGSSTSTVCTATDVGSACFIPPEVPPAVPQAVVAAPQFTG